MPSFGLYARTLRAYARHGSNVSIPKTKKRNNQLLFITLGKGEREKGEKMRRKEL
jgi:hypothetical protein